MSTASQPESSPDVSPETRAPVRTRGPRTRPAPPPPRDVRPLALGIVAVALAALALLLSVAGATGIIGGGGPYGACQRMAWAAVPHGSELPADWTVQSADFQPSKMAATLAGPMGTDGAQTTAYVIVTCYGNGEGPDALDRTRASMIEGGGSVDPLDNVAGGFRFTDTLSGATGAYFQRNSLVGSVAVAIGTPESEVTATITAIDSAMRRAQGSGGLAIPSPVAPPSGAEQPLPSDEPGASESPAASAAAPDLEAALPGTVNGVTLDKSSFAGTDVLQDSAADRAFTAALKQHGKAPTDFLLAQAIDGTQGLNLDSLVAFQVRGIQGSVLEPEIMNWYLSTGVSGVKTTDETIAGRKVKVVDYGEGSKSYVYSKGEIVFLVETSDPKLAETVIGLFK